MKQKLSIILQSDLEKDERSGCNLVDGWITRTWDNMIRIGSDDCSPEDGIEFSIYKGMKKDLIDVLNYLLTDEE